MDRFLCELKFSFLWDEYCSVQYVGCMVIAHLLFVVVVVFFGLHSKACGNLSSLTKDQTSSMEF